MKKILLTSFLFTLNLIHVSCDKKSTENHNTVKSSNKNFSVTVIDSCEYLQGDNSMTHKGNCEFCETREKKLLYDYYIDECNF